VGCHWGTALLLWARLMLAAKSQNHRLEKTSKVIESNRHPSTPVPAKPRPQVPHPHGV